MELLFLLLLILINGLFAMSEMALVSSRRARLMQRADAGSGGARAALQLADDPGRFLSTVQVGITTIGILSGAFGENAITERLIVMFDQQPLLADHSQLIATVIMVLVVTYFSVVLGELVPKRLALVSPESIASVIAPPMQLLARVVGPVVGLFSLSSNLILRALGSRPSDDSPVTEEEIKVMMQQGAAAGVFDAAEPAMVSNVFRLDALKVTAIMTPRLDIVSLDIEDPSDINHRVLMEGRFQSLPVCRGSLDEVLGLLDAKDFLARTLRGERPTVADAVHPAVFVPESISPMQLLDTLRQHHTHVALVVDEYGSVEGLVTFTDLLEAIVGELPAAGAPAGDAVRREDGSWLVDGMYPLERLERLGKLRERVVTGELEYHTVGGLAMDQLGRIPRIGDHFEWNGLRFEVLDMDGNRVDRMLVASAGPPPA